MKYNTNCDFLAMPPQILSGRPSRVVTRNFSEDGEVRYGNVTARFPSDWHDFDLLRTTKESGPVA